MENPGASRPLGRPADVREALLAAAEIEIGESGAGQVSLRAVARRAHVSHQAPGHFFVNRRGMFTALAARNIAQLHAVLRETVTRHVDDEPLVRLAILGMAYVDFSRAHPGLFTLAQSPDQIDVTDPDLDSARRAAWSVLAETVAQAQQSGWRTSQTTDSVALACWALVHGSSALWRGGWLADTHGEDSRQAIWEMLQKSL